MSLFVPCVDKLVDLVTYGCSGLSINCGHSVIWPSKKDSVLHQMFDPATQKANNLCFFFKMVFPKKKKMMVAVRALVINA